MARLLLVSWLASAVPFAALNQVNNILLSRSVNLLEDILRPDFRSRVHLPPGGYSLPEGDTTAAAAPQLAAG